VVASTACSAATAADEAQPCPLVLAFAAPQSGIAAYGQLCLTSSSAGAALVLSTLLRPHPALMRGAVAATLLLVPACDHLGPLLRCGEGAFELGDPASDPQVRQGRGGGVQQQRFWACS
jgi:hypothetical protein